MSDAPPTVDEMRRAAARLEGHIVRTPLLAAVAASERVGRRVLVKAEVLQRTGSFKIRGALTFLGLLEPEARQAGIVAYSSGNHAQGVAAAASAAGVPATIVMPRTAPAIKVRRTRGWGARVVLFDPTMESREEIAHRLVDDLGATLLPPYDHPWTIVGQGTLGLELAEQCAAAGVEAPTVLVPTGGGGLVAGIGIALAAEAPTARVYAVEPEGWDDHRLSLEEGERVRAPGGDTLCDSLLADLPGEVTFPINRRLLAGALAVDDAAVRSAMRHAFEELKLVAEPGGSVGLAAALDGAAPGDGPVVVVLSGGNVDAGLFAEVLRGA
jgi:threonine dehydratase